MTNIWNAFYLPGLGDFRQEQMKKKPWKKRVAMHSFWSSHLKSSKEYNHSTAGRKGKNGPELVPFCSYSWLEQSWAKYYSLAIWKHTVKGSPSAAEKQCLYKCFHSLPVLNEVKNYRQQPLMIFLKHCYVETSELCSD